MDKFDRIFQLDRLLRGRRRPVSLERIQQELECSSATAKRAIQHLRNHLNAPVRWDRERRGYLYSEDRESGYELPGLWFNADELYALLSSYRLLESIQSGLADEYVKPLRERLQRMLRNRRAGHAEVERRIRILPSAVRPLPAQAFRQVAAGLLERKRLHVRYDARGSSGVSERHVSPQRLVHYRSNWYLDAWCHLRDGLRSFAVDRIEVLDVVDGGAIDVPDAELDAWFASSYGIFAGAPQGVALLRFTPHAARWVADETWHPEQQARTLPDGGIEFEIPFGDPTELIMDVLKWGPDVEVVAPPELRTRVAARIEATLTRYATNDT